MTVYVSVGGKVVGSFDTARSALLRCIPHIAPGCNPKIKKCRHTGGRGTAAKRACNEARHNTTSQLGSYKRYPRMLKPGEFRLDT